jgi:hypothetical protein
MSLVDQFFAEECNEHVKAVLLEELSTRSQGSGYFTFNRFNVLVDVDGAAVTVADEFDPESSCKLELAVFRDRLERGCSAS